MTNLDIRRKCILIRGDVELWVAEERAKALTDALEANKLPKFVDIDGQLVNSFEILGVFTPEAMEERMRRKNGQWRCLKGKWHDRGNVCECVERKETVTAHVEGIGPVTYKR